MAADLNGHADGRLVAPLYGDAYLSNFGVFGSSENAVDLSDFDDGPLPSPIRAGRETHGDAH